MRLVLAGLGSLHGISHPKGTGMEQWSAEVWSRYSQSWMPGFDVVDETDWGYRLRRRTDGAMLPTDIAKSDVRHEGHG